MKNDLEQHWEAIYASKQIEKLGWFEETPEPSLQLIESCNLNKNAAILNVGAGATTLVDELLKSGYTNIIASDLSREALEKLKSRLGIELSKKARWIIDDLTNSEELVHLEPVDLWHDRAVLHFFNEKSEQANYFELINNTVKPGGYVIIAVFGLEGATSCSGLPVHRYDQHMLQERLGEKFKLLEAFDYTYTMPSSETRAYIYTLFRRIPE